MLLLVLLCSCFRYLLLLLPFLLLLLIDHFMTRVLYFSVSVRLKPRFIVLGACVGEGLGFANVFFVAVLKKMKSLYFLGFIIFLFLFFLIFKRSFISFFLEYQFANNFNINYVKDCR
jgi:hypothetical protein